MRKGLNGYSLNSLELENRLEILHERMNREGNSKYGKCNDGGHRAKEGRLNGC